MSGCQSFRPNLWKPDVCSECLRSRAFHHTTASEHHAVTASPDQTSCGGGPESNPGDYANMPLTDSKKRSSLKKKFNNIMTRNEKPPVPAPRRGFIDALDISAPIPIQLDASGRFKSESSFDSVSSVGDEAHPCADEFTIPATDRPYEEVFYEGDRDEVRDETAVNGHEPVAEVSVDGLLSTAESPTVVDAEEITTTVSPLPQASCTRPVAVFNGYTELDLDDPAPLPRPTVPESNEVLQLKDPPKSKPPLKAKLKINVAEQGACKRNPPPTPPPYSKKPSVKSEDTNWETPAASVEAETEAATDISPLTEVSFRPPVLSSDLGPRQRRRSKTVGSGVPRRRPPPAPPVKKALDVHFPLPSPSPVRRDEDGTGDTPPTKPARSRGRKETPGTSPVTPTRPPPEPPVHSTSSHSNSPVEPHRVSHSPAHSPLPSPRETFPSATAAATLDEPVQPMKRKNSLSKRMKHRFGFHSHSKAAPSAEQVTVSKQVEDKEQKKDQGEQGEGGTEKKGKGRKLFRKRSKTFSSGHKKAVHVAANNTSRDDSSFDFKGTNGSSSVSVRRTRSPEPQLPYPAGAFHQSTVESTIDHSHEYAECGEPLISKHIPVAAEQETSGNLSGGSRVGVAAGSNTVRSGGDRSSMCSEFLASLQPETVPVDPLIITVGQLQTLMAESVISSTKKVSSLYKRLYTPPSSVKCTWDDCKPVDDWPAVVVKDRTCAVQVMDEERWALEEEMASCLPPHPHIVRRLAIMSDPPPFTINGLQKPPQGKCIYMLTNAATNMCLRDYLAQQRSRLTQEKFERLVCLVLLQLFLALHHLYRHGVVHRNLTPKSILINPANCHVQLSDYSYALHKKGSFVYGAEEVKVLGGEDSWLPPEIVNNSGTQELNYSNTDVFQTGCLIYQLLGQETPFESEPELIYSYAMSDLPPLPPFSPYSLHLQRIAHLLLVPDPRHRISAATSLQVLSCLLWLPHTWITQPVPESHVQSFLIYEKTRLMADLAEMWVRRSVSAPSLEELLKSSFFTLMSTNQILKSLESYAQEISSFH